MNILHDFLDKYDRSTFSTIIVKIIRKEFDSRPRYYHYVTCNNLFRTAAIEHKEYN